MNEKGGRLILNAVIFAVVMVLTFWCVFRKQDLTKTAEAVSEMPEIYMAAALFLAELFVAAEGCMIWYLLRGVGGRTALLRCISYSFIGFFFSGLTPSATGGQPMQLYFMKRDGNPLSASSVVLMTVAVIYKLVLVLIGAGIVIFWRNPLEEYLGKYYGLYYFGLFLNTLLVAVLLMVMFSPEIIKRFYCKMEEVFVGIGIWKSSGRRQEKVSRFLSDYQEAVRFLKRHKGMITIVLAGTFVQRFTVFLLTCVVYKGLGLSGTAMMDIVFVQASVYIAVDMLPVPGAQGITEAMYGSVFGGIFPGSYLVASMCITRGIGFYAVMLIGFITFCGVNFCGNKKNMRIGDMEQSGR